MFNRKEAARNMALEAVVIELGKVDADKVTDGASKILDLMNSQNTTLAEDLAIIAAVLYTMDKSIDDGNGLKVKCDGEGVNLDLKGFHIEAVRRRANKLMELEASLPDKVKNLFSALAAFTRPACNKDIH